MINLPFLSTRAPALAGLDISSSSVKLVELAAVGKTGYRVERYAIETLPRDAVVDGNIANFDAVSEVLRRALRRFGTGVKNVAIALPQASVITKRITLPGGMREHEMEEAVESEANQYVPFPLDEVNLDFCVVGPATGGAGEVDVLVAVSRKDKVEDRVALAQAAGLKPVVVDVELLATQAALELVVNPLPEGGRNKLIGFIDVGSQAMHVTVMRNGQQVYAREQAFGGSQLTQDVARQYGMSFDDAELAKRAATLPESYERELLRPFMDNVALEVSRALQFFFTSTQFNQIDLLVLGGGCAAISELRQVVQARTQVEVLVANPFVNMEVSSRVRPKSLLADAPLLLTACGLALRRFDQ